MVYETSYESGQQPFLPDTKRGNWLNPNDFIYAGLSLAFRIDIFSSAWFLATESGVITFLPIYLICLATYIIPFLVIQSFMGQFSSSGYISAFRLAPLFKGIGYVTLVMNIFVLAYYSVCAMVPMLYMFASMNPTLPWSCEGFKKWAQNLTEEEEINLCNIKYLNESDVIEGSGGGDNDTSQTFINHHIPSALYFKSLFHDINLFSYEDMEFSMSWQLILCSLLVWALVAVIVYKLFKTEMFGTLIRYSVWTLTFLMTFFIIRFSFIPGATHAYRRLLKSSWREFAFGAFAIPIFSTSAFGPGWGIFITLSSYNKFKTNIMKTSWIIGVGQFFIIFGMALLMSLTESHFQELTEGNYYSDIEHIWILYLSTGSVMAHMPWANFWSILFFFMMFLGAMLLIIIQLHCILTTIYDEFVYLRENKLRSAMWLIGVMAITSLYFTSNHAIVYFSVLHLDTFITQTGIYILLILVVLWIYGRIRFQRDIEFMISQRISAWIINILRIVAPLGMLFVLIMVIYVAFHEHKHASFTISMFAIIFIFMPWLCIPGYAARLMLRSMGTAKARFQRCCRPTDWYPVQADDRQRYEEAMGNMEITHQLNEETEEVL